MADPENTAPRSGRVAIVGRPNVGKSTLLNALVGQRLAITTPRPGTTRSCLLGVHSRKEPPTQIAFVDTPGLGIPETALHRVLVEQARTGLVDVDAVLLMIAAPEMPTPNFFDSDRPALDAALSAEKPVVLVVNKVDRVKDKHLLLPALEAFEKVAEFAAIIPTSATKGTNVDAVVGELRKHLPEGLLYEEDFLTDRPERFFVSELVREAAISHTRQEVPYGVAVVIDEYVVEAKIVRIQATVVVEKDSHKKIIIGAGGSKIRDIGTEARGHIEPLVGKKVMLKLWVKVVPGWTNDPGKVRALALGEDS